MSNLGDLKDILRKKPIVKEYQPVEIIMDDISKTYKKQKREEKDDEEKEELEIEETKIPEEGIAKQRTQMEIIDEREKGFDRKALLERLAQNKIAKVVVPPVLKDKLEEEAAPKKRAKRVEGKKKLIIKEAEEIEVGKKDIIDLDEERKGPKMEAPEEKGVAILGPENVVVIGDTPIDARLPKKTKPVLIRAPTYYMNNREKFVNFINSLFKPYHDEIKENEENISCDSLGAKGSESISLLTHQKVVRDYMNLYTPYRGLLLYHGLGSGKTCSSIAIAEGMKDAKKIIVMTPAYLRRNYIEELKKCGDLIYKKNQYWEWISTSVNPDAVNMLSGVLNLPVDYINKKRGAWLVNIEKPSNFDTLNTNEKNSLNEQLDMMIMNKYTFINYNGLRLSKLKELTNDFTENLFDNSVVIIDEAHNLISRIVNKIKKEKPISETERGEKKTVPRFLATKLYEYLLSAQNARIILLTGTPVINYPNEFGILFNILRGYIKTWEFTLNIKTDRKINKESIQEMLSQNNHVDYIEYSSNKLTVTRNPFGFKNMYEDSKYKGVTNARTVGKRTVIQTNFVSDEDFERGIIRILNANNIEVLPQGTKIRNKKALPDTFDLFETQYIDVVNKELKNTDALKRRIIGLASYFTSAQESLLPKYNKRLGVDYMIERIEMSDYQFKLYEEARIEERKSEKSSRKKAQSSLEDIYKENTSTYRIFSRLFCNFVMPNRPKPIEFKKKKKVEGEEERKEDSEEEEITTLLKKAETNVDLNDANEGEVEGDELLEKVGGDLYVQKLEEARNFLEQNSNDYLTPEALETYSPKFLRMLQNITDEKNVGLHLVYSQFRTLEGMGIFSLVLEKNGFARFRIKKQGNDWVIDIPPQDQGKPMYALYTGTESAEEKEIIRNIYNGDWINIPTDIEKELKKQSRNNNLGEIIKVLMITSSGSEGINLRNTRFVHIMEPYWHPVRLEQVIGRARRICSHKGLPQELQTVNVFVYLMKFTEKQLRSDAAIELKKKDLSKSLPAMPLTSDQYLYEISEIKGILSSQLTEVIKEAAFDCYIYSNGKCLNFGNPSASAFSYVPDFSEEQTDVIAKTNKEEVIWVGKPITINGVTYVYRRMDKGLLNLYDKDSYLAAQKDPSLKPVLLGTYRVNEKGEKVVEFLVN